MAYKSVRANPNIEPTQNYDPRFGIALSSSLNSVNPSLGAGFEALRNVGQGLQNVGDVANNIAIQQINQDTADKQKQIQLNNYNIENAKKSYENDFNNKLLTAQQTGDGGELQKLFNEANDQQKIQNYIKASNFDGQNGESGFLNNKEVQDSLNNFGNINLKNKARAILDTFKIKEYDKYLTTSGIEFEQNLHLIKHEDYSIERDKFKQKVEDDIKNGLYPAGEDGQKRLITMLSSFDNQAMSNMITGTDSQGNWVYEKKTNDKGATATMRRQGNPYKALKILNTLKEYQETDLYKAGNKLKGFEYLTNIDKYIAMAQHQINMTETMKKTKTVFGGITPTAEQLKAQNTLTIASEKEYSKDYEGIIPKQKTNIPKELQINQGEYTPIPTKDTEQKSVTILTPEQQSYVNSNRIASEGDIQKAGQQTYKLDPSVELTPNQRIKNINDTQQLDYPRSNVLLKTEASQMANFLQSSSSVDEKMQVTKQTVARLGNSAQYLTEDFKYLPNEKPKDNAWNNTLNSDKIGLLAVANDNNQLAQYSFNNAQQLQSYKRNADGEIKYDHLPDDIQKNIKKAINKSKIEYYKGRGAFLEQTNNKHLIDIELKAIEEDNIINKGEKTQLLDLMNGDNSYIQTSNMNVVIPKDAEYQFKQKSKNVLTYLSHIVPKGGEAVASHNMKWINDYSKEGIDRIVLVNKNKVRVKGNGNYDYPKETNHKGEPIEIQLIKQPDGTTIVKTPKYIQDIIDNKIKEEFNNFLAY